MKRTLGIIGVTILTVSQVGCASSPNRAAEGSVIGGILGAGAGAIIGNQGHDRDQDRTRGALIGGAVGAIGGALAGSQIQKQPAQQQGAASARQAVNPNQISVAQILDMTRQGVHEDVIIDRIRLTNSKYNLSSADVDYLKSNGVSQKVLMEMQGF
ncbi:MAG TPA: glycine zipper domain-containing protein [Candidatus Omnitrophota bacterium]|nr:glycine zipper domain-containing protein [Candidatus Omnitrophota bacterium]